MAITLQSVTSRDETSFDYSIDRDNLVNRLDREQIGDVRIRLELEQNDGRAQVEVMAEIEQDERVVAAFTRIFQDAGRHEVGLGHSPYTGDVRLTTRVRTVSLSVQPIRYNIEILLVGRGESMEDWSELDSGLETVG